MVTVFPGGDARSVDDGGECPDVVNGGGGGLIGLEVALEMGIAFVLLKEVESVGFVIDSRVVPI